MSLSASLSNALSGMSVSQNSLEVLSRNVSNAGTPGYHRQSLAITDMVAGSSSYARSGTVQRAFNQSLQAHYTSAISQSGYTDTLASSLNRLQSFLGKPGEPGSLDTMFGQLQNALQALGTSPDNYATRASVVSQAQAMAATLNSLTNNVQELRREAETQMAAAVEHLNTSLRALKDVNAQLGDVSGGAASRNALMDQRDRLVADIAAMIDVKVEYRGDDTVAIMTRSGIGIADGGVASFDFIRSGAVGAESRFHVDPAQSGVGILTLQTISGSKIDVVQQGLVQSGRLGAMIELRDNALVAAQNQLDEIAAGLALAFSTNTVAGQTATDGTRNGFSLDLSTLQSGNDFTLKVNVGGAPRTIKVVRVDDPSSLPIDFTDTSGARVVGMDFSNITNVTSALSSLLGAGFTVSDDGSHTITVLDDGPAANTDVIGLTGHATSTDNQVGLPALNLFVDRGDKPFTNDLSGRDQKVGFAGRIAVSTDVLLDNTLLVRSEASTSLGNTTRADFLLDQFQTMNFASPQTNGLGRGSYRLAGTISDMIAQTMDHAGNVAGVAISQRTTQQLTMEALEQRMEAEYGVNVDEEMARLIELQNAYAANSRIIAAVQELMNRLMEI